MEVMTMIPRRFAATARYGLPGLALGLALAWSLGAAGGPAALAQSPPGAARAGGPGGSADGTIAFTTPIGAGGAAQLLYLIDAKTQAFAVYRVDPGAPKGAVKLEAARVYRYDLKLNEYNNLPPEVGAVEQMVKAIGNK